MTARDRLRPFVTARDRLRPFVSVRVRSRPPVSVRVRLWSYCTAAIRAGLHHRPPVGQSARLSQRGEEPLHAGRVDGVRVEHAEVGAGPWAADPLVLGAGGVLPVDQVLLALAQHLDRVVLAVGAFGAGRPSQEDLHLRERLIRSVQQQPLGRLADATGRRATEHLEGDGLDGQRTGLVGDIDVHAGVIGGEQSNAVRGAAIGREVLDLLDAQTVLPASEAWRFGPWCDGDEVPSIPAQLRGVRAEPNHRRCLVASDRSSTARRRPLKLSLRISAAQTSGDAVNGPPPSSASRRMASRTSCRRSCAYWDRDRALFITRNPTVRECQRCARPNGN